MYLLQRFAEYLKFLLKAICRMLILININIMGFGQHKGARDTKYAHRVGCFRIYGARNTDMWLIKGRIGIPHSPYLIALRHLIASSERLRSVQSRYVVGFAR